MDHIQWRCFHCGEVFNTEATAREHFGASPDRQPGCGIDLAAFRIMEERVQRCFEEESELHRELRRLRSEHAQNVRTAEEQGYARGLADARKEFQQCP